VSGYASTHKRDLRSFFCPPGTELIDICDLQIFQRVWLCEGITAGAFLGLRFCFHLTVVPVQVVEKGIKHDIGVTLGCVTCILNKNYKKATHIQCHREMYRFLFRLTALFYMRWFYSVEWDMEGCERRKSWPVLRCYPIICVKVLREPRKHLLLNILNFCFEVWWKFNTVVHEVTWLILKLFNDRPTFSRMVNG